MKLRRRTAKTAPVEAVCPSCGDRSDGRFCSSCGEEKGRDKDYSLLRHLGETFNVITNVEAGFLRSFTTLIMKPGQLTSEYFAGRRKPFLKPLQLFLFCNIAFFLIQSFTGSNTLSTPLRVHMNQLPYSAYARQKVNRTILEKGTTLKEYQARFDTTIEAHAKTLVFLMIPMFALLLQVLYWRAGRYFVEHVVFATHFYSFFLLLFSAVLLLTGAAIFVARRFTTNLALFENDFMFSLILLGCFLTYLLFAIRRVYKQSWLLTALKGVVLVAGVMVIMQLYRFCLFFTASYWV